MKRAPTTVEISPLELGQLGDVSADQRETIQNTIIMPTDYYSTSDICQRFRCSSRTIFRRMSREVNPFPKPCIRTRGAENLWDVNDVSTWEAIERARNRPKK